MRPDVGLPGRIQTWETDPAFRRSLVRHARTGALYVLLELPGWSQNGVGDILGIAGPLQTTEGWQKVDVQARSGFGDPDLWWAQGQPWQQLGLSYD